jgi:two-component system CheB/CheR fusion protein
MSEHFSQRILIIEDDPDSAESLKMLLEINDCMVEIASDGESGLETARRFKPQIIICDIGLPGKINGLEVARIIKNDGVLSSVHMIALSGYGQFEDIQETRSAGFHHHLVKPADFDRLIVLVKNLQNPN